ncbi:MAG: pirin family protein [Acidithiobacillus sp.]
MIEIRKSEDRGHANHGWLDSYHTFSFAGYHDPDHIQFGSLRVINEDRVQPGQGFGKHGHRDMEIVSYVLEGALKHSDSMGNGSIIRPGDVQRMSAGTGITHSEYNASQSDPLHFLQIWILPETLGLAPSYEQKYFTISEKRDRLCLLVSPDGHNGSVTVHQDVRIYSSVLENGGRVNHTLVPGRRAYVQLTSGRAEVNGQFLHAGDGAGITNESSILLTGVPGGEVLIFDLA